MKPEHSTDHKFTSVTELLLLKYFDDYKGNMDLDTAAEIMGFNFNEIIGLLNDLIRKNYLAFDAKSGYYKVLDQGFLILQKNRLHNCSMEELLTEKRSSSSIVYQPPQFINQVYLPSNLKEIARQMIAEKPNKQ